MKTFIKGQRGSAIIMVTALMVLAIPVTAGALHLSNALAKDSIVKNEIMKRQYLALAGLEYGVYQLAYDDGYAEGLSAGVPEVTEITLNGETLTITTEADDDPPSGEAEIDSDNSRRLQVTETVSPSSVTANTFTTYTYTIVVENTDNVSEQLKKVMNDMPTGFSYVTGSTSGVTTANPTQSGSRLTWNMTSDNIVLPAGGGQATLVFQATATAAEGIFCSEAWTDPGNKKSSTGLTAKVTSGNPSSSICSGAVLVLDTDVSPSAVANGNTNTFTYTLTLTNEGTSNLKISKIENLLPPGFTYEEGSTTGTITSSDPSEDDEDGRWELTWSFSPKYTLASGETKTLVFEATANPNSGTYWNEVWVYTDEIPESTYSWPTAPVYVMAVINLSISMSGADASMQVWLGPGSGGDYYYVVQKRNVRHH